MTMQTRTHAWRVADRHDERAAMTGLERLRAMLAPEADRAPMLSTLAFEPVVFDHGLACFEGAPDTFHLNGAGAVHGGYFATLLDSAMSCAVESALPAGAICATIDLRVSLPRGLASGVGRVRAKGRLLHLGGRLGFADGRLTDASGAMIATGSVTCAIRRLAKDTPHEV